MAILVPTILKFTPSTSPDVTGYALYIRKASDGAVNETDEFGNYVAARFEVVPPTPGEGEKAQIDLASIPGMITEDTTYNIGLAAIDDVGNESSLEMLTDVPLDFAAPNPPTNLEIV